MRDGKHMACVGCGGVAVGELNAEEEQPMRQRADLQRPTEGSTPGVNEGSPQYCRLMSQINVFGMNC